MDRCEDTNSLLQGYVGDKGQRTVSSPGGGPRHTIDHILGLARREEVLDGCRADTPGTGNESAGECPVLCLFYVVIRLFRLLMV